MNIRPPPIEVLGSSIWKDKDISKIEDLKVLEKTFDWSFSTPYKGTILKYSKGASHINEKEVKIDSYITLPSSDSG